MKQAKASQAENTIGSSLNYASSLTFNLLNYLVTKPLHVLVSLLALQAVTRPSLNRTTSPANVMARTGLFMIAANIPLTYAYDPKAVAYDPSKDIKIPKDGDAIWKVTDGNRLNIKHDNYEVGYDHHNSRYTGQITHGDKNNHVYGGASVNDNFDHRTAQFEVGFRKEL